MEFKERLDCIAEDLKKHKRDKATLLEMYINDRLNKSLEVYYNELSDSLQYLAGKNDIKIMKKINRW